MNIALISRLATRAATSSRIARTSLVTASSTRALSFFHLSDPSNDLAASQRLGGMRNMSTSRDQMMYERSPPRHMGIVFAPQQEAWVIERLGKFKRVLDPGINFLIPVFDRIAYCHSLKETSLEINKQSAITLDNVTLRLDGVLYWKVVDPIKASYGIDQCTNAILQLAQTTMRSEIGKMSLDSTFAEREALNIKITDAINDAAINWGLECLRYEIRDIVPNEAVRASLDLQSSAERRKRQKILDAQGAASAITARAEATAASMEALAQALTADKGHAAANLRLTQDYLRGYAKLGREDTTVLLPSDITDPEGVVRAPLDVIDNVRAKLRESSLSSKSA